MTIETFNKRYISHSSPVSVLNRTQEQSLSGLNATNTTSYLHNLTQKAYMHATGNGDHLNYSPIS